MADSYPIAGCPFQIPVGAGTKPQPCIRVQWLAPAVRVVAGAPVILQGKDRETFAEFYKYATEKGTLFDLLEAERRSRMMRRTAPC